MTVNTENCSGSLSVNKSGVYCGFSRDDEQGERVYFDQDVPETLPGGLTLPVADDTVIASDHLVVTNDAVFVLADSNSAYVEPASIYRVAR